MESTIWSRFAHFVKESYTHRFKQSFSGVVMGFFSANNLLFAGQMANLVTPFWWIVKGIGSVMLAFFMSMATSYGAYLIEIHKEKREEKKSQRKKRNKAA